MDGKRIGQIIFVVIFLMAFVAADIWAAGFIFLLINGIDTSINGFNTWWLYWQAYNTDPIIRKKLLTVIVAPALALLILITALIIAHHNKKRALHGDARFANIGEIREAELLSDKRDSTKEIIVGMYRGQYLTFGGQQFVIVSAPTRSWKGVAIVIPNLLNFSDSVVVLDIKQENYNLTAGFRAAHGQEVFLFNPFAEDYRTHRYNPFAYVRQGDFRIGDLSAIAKILYPADDPKNQFWDEQAANLFVGIALYLFETTDLPKTFGELRRQSLGKGQAPHEYLQSIINQRNYVEVDDTDDAGDIIVDDEGNPQKTLIPKTEWGADEDAPLTAECVDALNQFITMNDTTRSSTISSFNAPLSNWINPVVDAATAANDFDLRDVRKKRMSIYVGITPDYLPQASRLLNLFFSQLLNLNTKVLPEDDPTLKYQCLIVADEFTAMGKVQILAKGISYMAGYNMRMLTIIQSIAQLESVYGRDDARTFMTNHAMQIIFAPKEQRDAKDYSEMLGNDTVRNKSESRSKSGKSESESDQRRALLLPQEIKNIGIKREIIILENCMPILCEKIKYYADPVFKKRYQFSKNNIPAAYMLDMEQHKAIVEQRIRTVDEDDLSAINLSALTIDLSRIKVPDLQGDQESLSDEDVNAFVTDFFTTMGVDPKDLEIADDGMIDSISIPDLPESETNDTDQSDTSFAFPDVLNLDERINEVNDFWIEEDKEKEEGNGKNLVTDSSLADDGSVTNENAKFDTSSEFIEDENFVTEQDQVDDFLPDFDDALEMDFIVPKGLDISELDIDLQSIENDKD